MMTDGMKQHVNTRCATINAATSLLSLINGHSATVRKSAALQCSSRPSVQEYG